MAPIHWESNNMKTSPLLDNLYTDPNFAQELCEPKPRCPATYPILKDWDSCPKPAYRNIFNNARLRNSEYCSAHAGPPRQRLLFDSNHLAEELATLAVPSLCARAAEVEKNCELLDGKDNNVVTSIRGRKWRNMKQDSVVSLFKTTETEDNVGRFFKEKPVREILDKHISQKMSKIQKLGGEQESFDDVDWDVLKNDLLKADGYIDMFQDLVSDTRWRENFRLEEIEDSEKLSDTDDDSDDSSMRSVCSSDSVLRDFKMSDSVPSKIPYIREVYRQNEILYDKLISKWENIVRTNSSRSYTYLPHYRRFCANMGLHINEPVYRDIINILMSQYMWNPRSKTFTPRKVLERRKLDAKAKAIEKTLRTDQLRKSIEKVNLPRYVEKVTPLSYEPTKYLNSTRKERLKNILRATKTLEKEGVSEWRKRGIFDDYVNLRPIIATKPSRGIKTKVLQSQVRSKRFAIPH